MSNPIQTTVESLAQTLVARATVTRLIVAVAGAPGSGKSTLAERLEALLNQGQPDAAAILPMDGYHFDDRLLVPRGLRARKGAPDTFDVGGLLAMLQRLRRNEEDEIAVPVFDRDLEIARAGARMIPRSVRYLLVEGNYLLLDEQPWSALCGMFDMTVMVDEPEEVLRQRLIARWRGYNLAAEEIEAKVESNDLPNGRYIRDRSATADFVLRGEAA